MPRKAVVQVQCSRCPRVDTIEAPPESADEKKEPDFMARLSQPNGKPMEVVFADLCTVCCEILTTGLEGFLKVTKSSAKRKKKMTVEEAKAKLEAMAAEKTGPVTIHNAPPPPLRAPRG